MAITTLEEVKKVAKITSTDYDSLIEYQIPIVEEAILNYTNNDFFSVKKIKTEGYLRLPNVSYRLYNDTNVWSSNEFVFVTGDNTITGDNEDFISFEIGDSIRINQSIRNIGNYTIIDKVDNNTITVAEDVSNETEDCVIILVVYPKSVSNIAAKMVIYDLMKRNKESGLSSQSIGTWSASYSNLGSNGYPEDLNKLLNQFKYHRSL